MIVLLGGLKSVENVLGYAGIVILAYVVIFMVITMLKPGASLAQAETVEKAADAGIVWKANLFALPPLSRIPGLSRLNNGPLEGALYAALCSVSGFPFYYSLGKRAHSGKEAAVSGVVTAICFFLCVTSSLILMLMNGNAFINKATGAMFDFPTLAAINNIWPKGSWTYTLIIFVGIFTTTAGYLWVINDLFFHESHGKLTKKGRVLVVAMLIAGICLGGVVPFSALINFMFPLTGVVGIILMVCGIVRAVEIRKKSKKPEITAETETMEEVEEA